MGSQGEHPTTGRADYFGSVINLAARTAAAAQAGQILVALKERTSESDIKKLTRSCGSVGKTQPAMKSRTLWNIWRWVEDLGELGTPLGSAAALSPSGKSRVTSPSRSPRGHWV